MGTKKIKDSEIFRLIQIHYNDFTYWDSHQRWVTLFCSCNIGYDTSN